MSVGTHSLPPWCADELAKQGKKTLKAVVKDIGGGVSAGDGKEWGWDEQEVVECVSPRSFVEIMAEIGVDPWQFLSVTPAKFRDALAELADGDQELLISSVGKTKKRRSFGLQKIRSELNGEKDMLE